VSADPDDLTRMLTRLKLTALRDQLDTLLDEAARRELSLREALAFLCEAEVARKDERRIQMAMSIAKFPFVRTLEEFEYDAYGATIRMASATIRIRRSGVAA
ncbi:ATP-binding protein, partial [Azospirillum sp.]|uniref:ATP-binding protein n=1 Tax=Azospirillum sp. TaxID=34012 RepID=UPI002D379C6A